MGHRSPCTTQRKMVAGKAACAGIIFIVLATGISDHFRRRSLPDALSDGAAVEAATPIGSLVALSEFLSWSQRCESSAQPYQAAIWRICSNHSHPAPSARWNECRTSRITFLTTCQPFRVSV